MSDVVTPWTIDASGRTSRESSDAHLRSLIEQVLFTTPGERVNRPTFGSALLQSVFAPTSPEVAATVEMMAQAALQQWLGELIEVQAVRVASEDSTLRVTVQFAPRRTGEVRVAEFVREA